MKIGVVLLLLMLGGMTIVPMLSAEKVSQSKFSKCSKTINEFQGPKPINGFNQSREFLDYMNAPAITQNEKDQSQRIITDAKGLAKFKDLSHGPVNVGWAYPYTGKQRITMVVGSEKSDTYGLYYAHYDPESNTVLDEGFVNWKKYW